MPILALPINIYQKLRLNSRKLPVYLQKFRVNSQQLWVAIRKRQAFIRDSFAFIQSKYNFPE